MQIGFIGAGAMGGPMIRNLLAAGHSVAVHTRQRRLCGGGCGRGGAVGGFGGGGVRRGGESCSGLCRVRRRSSRWFEGRADWLRAWRRGASMWTWRRIRLRWCGCCALTWRSGGSTCWDAPISGGPKGATSRKLAIWASGREAAFERVKPVLDQLGDRVRYLGASGNASIAKLVHNSANYGVQMVLAEAMTMGVRAGVDPAVLFAAVRQGSLGRQPVLDRLADHFLPGGVRYAGLCAGAGA